LKVEQDLEQWDATLKAGFPLGKRLILNNLFNAFNVTPPVILRYNYNYDEFLDEIIRPHKELNVVNVRKKRFGFIINRCMCEIAEVYIDEHFIKTAAIESTVVPDILKTRSMLKLDSYMNINYLKAIKTSIGQ
jgi:hypothetical protein